MLVNWRDAFKVAFYLDIVRTSPFLTNFLIERSIRFQLDPLNFVLGIDEKCIRTK